MSVARAKRFWKRPKRVLQGPNDFENGQNECRKAQTILETAKMSVARANRFWKWQKWVSQGPNDFENGKNKCRKGQTILEMAQMGHYGTVQILKRRIDKNDEARDIRRGPRS